MKTRINLSQLSKKLKSTKELPNWLDHHLPISVQVRTLRKALGMTQKQLAERINGYQGDIAALENGARGGVQISTLQKIAEALESELLVSFIPKEELAKLLEQKSLALAKKMVAMSSGNMAMELQKPNKEVIESEIKELKEEILKKKRSALWKKDEK